MAKRGRRVGTTKRDLPRAAARDIRDRKFVGIREAAKAYRARHAMSDDSFRDFVNYVEEAVREMGGSEFGSFRWARLLKARDIHRQRQPIGHHRSANLRKLKRLIAEDLG